MSELITPKENEEIEGCWDKNCVNPYTGTATGERHQLGVKALCGKSYYIFEYWRYNGDEEWIE